MILVDYSGSVFAAIAVELRRNAGTKTDINFLRNIILKQLKSYQRKFSEEYGEMIVCLDCHTGNWRRDIFPAYKYQRRKKKIDSGVDWNSIFADVDIITKEFMNVLPYKFIYIENLEADDVIAILTKHAKELSDDNVLIVSNDKDYKQLHKYEYVYQYFPKTQIVKKETNTDFALTELILHGDKSDGIPNIRSDKDIFTEENRRQASISTEFIRKFLKEGMDALTIFEKERYEFNKLLISFDEIPSKYDGIVLEEYGKKKKFSRFELMQYFARNGLKEMLDHIGEF